VTTIDHELATDASNVAESARAGQAGAPCIQVAGLAARTIVVRWEIPAESLGAVLDGAPRPAEARWVLEWRLEPDGAATAALCALAGLECERPVHRLEILACAQRPPLVRWVRDGARALEHADIPGLLSLTFRIEPGCASDPVRPRLLHARTSLLDRLRIPGGHADRPQSLVI
jgi:hypothetical protein